MGRAKSAKNMQIRDLTGIDTIYTIHPDGCTFRVKRRPEFKGGIEGIDPLTILRTADNKQVLDVIFATLDDDQEHFVMLLLNLALELVGYKVIASGAENYVDVDPKLVFRSALLLGGGNIILAQNRANGKTEPTSHDLALTAQLCLGGRLLNIGILDHFIWTKKAQFSIREHTPALFGDRQNHPQPAPVTATAR